MTRKHLIKSQPPRSSTAAFAKVKQVFKMGWINIPDKKGFGGSGAPGKLLEHLLGVDGSNQDSPDLMDWEVKFHGGNAPVTLFHKEPEPRGIMRSIVHENGWDDEKGRISFRHTVIGESKRGFYAVNESDRIVVRHRHKDTVVPSWRHNTLNNIIGGKLRRLIVVEGKTKTHPRRVIYQKATAYWECKFNVFFDGIEKGIVQIDFDARTKGGTGTALRNHGTKFRVKNSDIASLYEHTKKIPNR